MLRMVEFLCHSFQVKQIEYHNDYKMRDLLDNSAHILMSHASWDGYV